MEELKKFYFKLMENLKKEEEEKEDILNALKDKVEIEAAVIRERQKAKIEEIEEIEREVSKLYWLFIQDTLQETK